MGDLNTKVLIIGAGISGLALAQGLSNSGIPFHVYESDPTPEFRPQGYRFRIHGYGTEALRELLTPALFQRFEKICATTVLKQASIDALTGMVKPFQGGPPGRGGPPGARPDEPMPYTADRTVTRDLLMRGIESNITFDRRLEWYEINDDGGVVAFFTNGSSAEGKLLVGAEGVRSVVRKQYLPQHIIFDTNCRCIYGKTIISPELERRMKPEALKGITVIKDLSSESPLILFLEAMRFQDNELRGSLPKDYIYWVLASDRSRIGGISDSKLLSLSSSDAAELSLMLTEGWHESSKALLEMQDKSMASALRFSMASADTLTSEPTANITLIGDAVHVLPPTGALGANSALADAASLTRELKKGVNLKSIAQYEKDMKSRASEAIERSVQGGKHLLGMRDVSKFLPIEP